MTEDLKLKSRGRVMADLDHVCVGSEDDTSPMFSFVVSWLLVLLCSRAATDHRILNKSVLMGSFSPVPWKHSAKY